MYLQLVDETDTTMSVSVMIFLCCFSCLNFVGICRLQYNLVQGLKWADARSPNCDQIFHLATHRRICIPAFFRCRVCAQASLRGDREKNLKYLRNQVFLFAFIYNLPTYVNNRYAYKENTLWHIGIGRSDIKFGDHTLLIHW